MEADDAGEALVVSQKTNKKAKKHCANLLVLCAYVRVCALMCNICVCHCIVHVHVHVVKTE